MLTVGVSRMQCVEKPAFTCLMRDIDAIGRLCQTLKHMTNKKNAKAPPLLEVEAVNFV